MTVILRWAGWVVLALGVSCVRSPGATASVAPAAPVEPPATVAVAVAHAGQEQIDLRELETFLDELRTTAPLFDDSGLRVRSAAIPKAKGDVQEIYRKVAPATVLIRSKTGFGTGVIIDGSGFILTNHHVVAKGWKEDFRTKVTVEMGLLTELGVMEKTGQVLDAYVHKSDPLLDLALIKLAAPPAQLPVVKVSKSNPMPGEAVSSLGNGGVGLLWAIKDGEISSMGRLATHLAQLAGGECEVSNDEASAAACERSRKAMDAMKKTIERKIPGLVIQSSCTISPGDSGGPLVNRAGELVGLNAFLRSDRAAPVSANFHIHVDEIRRFMTEVPAQANRALPDPWKEIGARGVLMDSDLDGQPEVLAFKDGFKGVTFVDLDQDSFTQGAPPPVQDIADNRAFDAELAVVADREQAQVFYDSDNDGRFDRLLTASASAKGKAEVAYMLGLNEEVSRQPNQEGGPLLNAEVFPEPRMNARLRRVAEVSFPKWLDAPANATAVLPDPIWGGGRAGVGSDTDRDGKLDSIWTLSPFSGGLLVDTDQSSLGSMRGAEVKKAVESRKVGANFSLISQGSQMWSFVDTNGDEKFDVVLYSANSASGVASEAHKLVDGQRDAPLPEHVGLKLVRPAMLSSSDSAARLRGAVRRYYPPHLLAKDDTPLSALPSPVADVGLDIDFEEVDSPAYRSAVVSVLGKGASSILFDLDRDSFKGKKPQREISKVVLGGQFKAEFAWMNRGGAEWTYYDTNRDGRFDLVLFTTKPNSGQAEQAFRIDKQGRLNIDSAAAKGRMLRPELFSKEQAKAFRVLAPQFFRSALLES